MQIHLKTPIAIISYSNFSKFKTDAQKTMGVLK